MPQVNVRFGDPAYADAQVKHSNNMWPVHCLLLCDKSLYFKKAFSSDKTGFKESLTRIIDLGDTDFAAENVEAMLRYIYGEGYPTYLRMSKDIMGNIVMFQMGDYFMIPELKQEATLMFKDAIQHGLYAGRHSDIRTFAMNIQDVLDNYGGHPELVGAIAEVLQARSNMKVLLWYKPIRKILKSHPDLGVAILERVYPRPESLSETAAQKHSHAFDDLCGGEHAGPAKRPRGKDQAPVDLTSD